MEATTDKMLGDVTEVAMLGSTSNCRSFWQAGAVASAFLSVIGFAGNALVAFVFGRTKQKTPTMYLITNLAKADALVSLTLFVTVAFPPYVAKGSLVAVSVAYLSNISYTLNQISIFFTTILVWQRYVAICKPHSAKTWANMKTLRRIGYAAVVFSIITYFPGFFKHRLEQGASGRLQAVLTSLGKNEVFYYIHTIIFMNLISYFIPVAFDLFATVNLIKSLRQPTSSTTSASASRAKKELTLSVVVIVVLFMAFQLFRPVRYVLMWVFTPYSQHIVCGGKLQVFAPTAVMMIMLNTSVNYFIYVICAKGFRKKVAAILCRKKTSTVGETSKTDTELDVDKE